MSGEQRDPLCGRALNLCVGVLFVLGVIIFLPGKFLISWDLTTYLAAARNLMDGHGFVDPAGQAVNSRLGYIVILAAVTAVTGPSLAAIAMLEAAASALLMVGTFLVARAMFGTATALLTVVLWLLSPDWNFWLPRHLDPFWPAMLMLSLAYLMRPLNGQEGRIALASAALFVIGYSIKETAAILLLAVGLAVLLGAFGDRRRRVFQFLLLSASAIAVIVAAQTFGHSAPVNPHAVGRLNVMHELVRDETLLNAIVNLVMFFVDGLMRVFFEIGGSSKFAAAMPLMPVVVLGLIANAVVAFRSGGSDRLLVVLVLANLPFMALIGQLDFRPSQNLFIVGLMYISAAALVMRTCRLVSSNPAMLVAVSGCTVAALVVWQAQTGVLNLKKSQGRNYVWRACCAKRNIEPFAPNLRGMEVASWVRANTNDGSVLMIGHSPAQHGVNFLNGLRNRMIFPPLYNLSFAGGWADSAMAPGGYKNYQAAGVWPGKIFPRPVFLLDPQWFLDSVGEAGAMFAVLSDKGVDPIIEAWLRTYFGISPVGEIEEGLNSYRVFEIHDLEVSVADSRRPLLVNQGFLDYFAFVNAEHRERWQWYVDELFEQRLGMTAESADSIAAGQIPKGVRVWP